MYIVVVGGGKVGFHLAKALLDEGQEVLVIEKDQEKVDRILTELGGTAIRGDGAEVSTLESAGVERADVVAAVTGDDEDNLVISQVARLKFDVPRTVARVNDPRNEFVFAKLGIDATVSATQVILSVIQQEIPKHSFVHLLTMQEGNLEIVELQLEGESPVVGRAVGEVVLPPETAVPVILRDGKPQVVGAQDIFAAGDKVIVITNRSCEERLRKDFLGE